MIISNSYFKGRIFIPQAKPSLSQDLVDVGGQFDLFRDEFEKECLVRLFGYKLTNELLSQIDTNTQNLVKDGADEKWNTLINGEEYTDPQGNVVYFKGLRYKDFEGSTVYKSLIADYVYSKYQPYHFSSVGQSSEVRGKSKNAVNVSPDDKIARAWNNFYDLAFGKLVEPDIKETQHGVFLDYFDDSKNVSLYKYVEDKNTLNDDYPSFEKGSFERINSFGV